MKNYLGIYHSILMLLVLAILPATTLLAQTDGTLTFTFTETVSGASKNVMAVWVEDNSGTFVKTKLRYWGNGTNDHLPTWVSKSNKNVVDATTGATLSASTNPTAFGEKSITWDGKNISSEIVPDGTYKLFVETAWSKPEPSKNQHSAITSFTFDKGATEAHITPTSNDSHFSNITIDWIPAGNTAVNDLKLKNDLLTVYPNPSKGMLQLKFKQPGEISRILVENMQGQIVYRQSINNTVSESLPLDLQYLNSGIYFVEVLSKDNTALLKSKFIIKQ